MKKIPISTIVREIYPWRFHIQFRDICQSQEHQQEQEEGHQYGCNTISSLFLIR